MGAKLEFSFSFSGPAETTQPSVAIWVDVHRELELIDAQRVQLQQSHLAWIGTKELDVDDPSTAQFVVWFRARPDLRWSCNIRYGKQTVYSNSNVVRYSPATFSGVCA